MKQYAIYLCGDTSCPCDPNFEHRFYFGCVPKDFSERTGRSKTQRQRNVTAPDLRHGYRFMWTGGCDGAAWLVRLFTGRWPQSLAVDPHAKPAIVLHMEGAP